MHCLHHTTSSIPFAACAYWRTTQLHTLCTPPLELCIQLDSSLRSLSMHVHPIRCSVPAAPHFCIQCTLLESTHPATHLCEHTSELTHSHTVYVLLCQHPATHMPTPISCPTRPPLTPTLCSTQPPPNLCLMQPPLTPNLCQQPQQLQTCSRSASSSSLHSRGDSTA
jgi:hypothetical protein